MFAILKIINAIREHLGFIYISDFYKDKDCGFITL